MNRFAKNWVELAEALGTTRRTLQTWREDPRFVGKLPAEKSDGRKDVQAWREFIAEHNLRRVVDEATDEAPAGERPPGFEDQVRMIAGVPGTEADWRKLLIKEKVEQARAQTGELKGTLLEAAALEAPLGAVMVACTNFLTQLPERLAPEVIGFRNVHELTKIIRAETEAGLSGLNSAGYLLEAGELAAAVPFDEETEKLFALVQFDGMDRTPWRKLIELSVVAVLRRIGARAIAAARSVPADVVDVVTGQVTEEAAEGAALERAGGRKKTKGSRRKKAAGE